MAPRNRLAQAIGLAGAASLIMNAVAPADRRAAGRSLRLSPGLPAGAPAPRWPPPCRASPADWDAAGGLPGHGAGSALASARPARRRRPARRLPIYLVFARVGPGVQRAVHLPGAVCPGARGEGDQRVLHRLHRRRPWRCASSAAASPTGWVTVLSPRRRCCRTAAWSRRPVCSGRTTWPPWGFCSAWRTARSFRP